MTPLRSFVNTNVKKSILAVLGLALALVLASCNTAQPAVTSVSISNVPATFNVGDTATLKVSVLPAAVYQAVSWSSSDASVVTVSDKGVIAAVKAGTAKITATSKADPSKSDTVSVTVKNPSVSSVTIDQGNQAMIPGDTANLTATVAAAGGADASVTWSSSDTSVATVTKTGPDAATLTAVAVGTATITATSAFDNTQTASITVTVTPTPAVTSVAINQGNQTLTAGQTPADSVNLTATVAASGGADPSVTWSSSDTSVATVASTGADAATVTAVAVGSATITATSNFDGTQSASITVTVNPAPAVTSVAINQGNQTLTAGQTPADSVNLTATVTAVGGADPSVTWSSSDTTVASVTQTSAGATVTAVGVGTATITATSNFDNAKSDSITVTVSMPAANPNSIYVDANAAAGGNGSQPFPFQTISAGIGAVASGGTVHVAAGTYAESVAIAKPMTLAGAGVGSTIIQVTNDVPTSVHTYSLGGIDVAGASNVTLQGFSVQTQAGGTLTNAIAAYTMPGTTPAAGGLVINNVAITQNDGTSNGIDLVSLGGLTSVVQNTSITATTASHTTGAGVKVDGSSNVTLTGVSTSGHDRYAGVLLFPDAAAMSTLSVSGTFAEHNSMELDLRGGGTLTNLSASQFTYVVRNINAPSNLVWFYKPDQATAILDSLFNFGPQWLTSTIQPVTAADQSQLQNVYVAGSADGAPYGLTGTVRANSIQAAINAAASGATVNLVPGPGVFNDEQVTVNKANLTIQGATDATYGITTLSMTTAPVLTTAAAGVTVTGVEVDSPDIVHAGVMVNAGATGFAITSSNLLSSIALDDTAGVGVDASKNYWGSTDGPSGDYTGSGTVLIDPTSSVVVVPYANAAY